MSVCDRISYWLFSAAFVWGRWLLPHQPSASASALCDGGPGFAAGISVPVQSILVLAFTVLWDCSSNGQRQPNSYSRTLRWQRRRNNSAAWGPPSLGTGARAGCTCAICTPGSSWVPTQVVKSQPHAYSVTAPAPQRHSKSCHCARKAAPSASLPRLL